MQLCPVPRSYTHKETRPDHHPRPIAPHPRDMPVIATGTTKTKARRDCWLFFVLGLAPPAPRSDRQQTDRHIYAYPRPRSPICGQSRNILNLIRNVHPFYNSSVLAYRPLPHARSIDIKFCVKRPHRETFYVKRTAGRCALTTRGYFRKST